MATVARDLHFTAGVFAILAAILFAISYEALACRMRAFFCFTLRHDISPLVGLVVLVYLGRLAKTMLGTDHFCASALLAALPDGLAAGALA